MIIFFRIENGIYRLYCEKKPEGGTVATFEKTEPFERISVDSFNRKDDATAAARSFLRRKFRRWEEFPTFDKKGTKLEWHIFDAGEKESLFGINRTIFKGGFFSEAKEAYWAAEGPSDVFRTFADNPQYGYFFRPAKPKRIRFFTKLSKENPKEDIPIFGLIQLRCRTDSAPRDESDEAGKSAIAFRKRFALKNGEAIPGKATKDPDTIAFFIKHGKIVKKEGRFIWKG